MPAKRLLSAADCTIHPLRIPVPTAVFSLDLEADFGGDCFHGVPRVAEAVATLDEEGVPATLFVEGRVIENDPVLVEQLARQADVQLHCYDHRQGGDNTESLTRSIRAYKALLGRSPDGYRAHTFRLDAELYRALIAASLKWDSSVLPMAFGHGANCAREWRTGQREAFSLDEGALLEFPVATLRRLPMPFTHAYQALGRPLLFRMLASAGGLPRLCIYDMHMVDLVRVPCLHHGREGAALDLARRLTWAGRGDSTFRELRLAVRLLRSRGYRFMTVEGLYRELRQGVNR